MKKALRISFVNSGFGSGVSAGVGYSFLPDAKILYQQMSTRVEVNDIGDDRWKFGALNFTLALSF
jgi:hypothetical protein